MLFRRDIAPRCAYCKKSSPAGENTVICRIKGVCIDSGYCRRFKYEPLKRVPPKHKLPDFSKYDEENYSL